MYIHSTPHTHTHKHSLECEQLTLHVLGTLCIKLLIRVHYAKYRLASHKHWITLFFS